MIRLERQSFDEVDERSDVRMNDEVIEKEEKKASEQRADNVV